MRKTTIEIPAITKFLDDWKVRMIAHTFDKIEEAREAKRNLPPYRESREAYLKWVEEYRGVRDYLYYSVDDMKEKVVKDITRAADYKYDAIITKTLKICGTITDASYLTIGNNGELNGLIKGTDGDVWVDTILAGGYNIQCLHFRTLIKKIKK